MKFYYTLFNSSLTMFLLTVQEMLNRKATNKSQTCNTEQKINNKNLSMNSATHNTTE